MVRNPNPTSAPGCASAAGDFARIKRGQNRYAIVPGHLEAGEQWRGLLLFSRI
jgi:hypothetical protein